MWPHYRSSLYPLQINKHRRINAKSRPSDGRAPTENRDCQTLFSSSFSFLSNGYETPPPSPPLSFFLGYVSARFPHPFSLSTPQKQHPFLTSRNKNRKNASLIAFSILKTASSTYSTSILSPIGSIGIMYCISSNKKDNKTNCWISQRPRYAWKSIACPRLLPHYLSLSPPSFQTKIDPGRVKGGGGGLTQLQQQCNGRAQNGEISTRTANKILRALFIIKGLSRLAMLCG